LGEAGVAATRRALASVSVSIMMKQIISG